jgi:hypothetical protein
MTSRNEFRVTAGTKLAEFLRSTASVSVLEGPLGSGKSYALCAKIMRHAQEQAPSPIDGLRYTRFAVVRNTTPDLKRTTVRTWLELFPEDIYGKFRIGAPMGCDWNFGDVRCQIDFIGLDKDEDIRKLRSGEYTGIFFDELEFIEQSLFDEARSRLRYPPKRHCDPATGEPTWRGVCAATNAPPEDHWLSIMTGRVEFPAGLRPDELAAMQWPRQWEHLMQPPALIEELDQHGNVIGYHVNPDAENLQNLVGYYETQHLGHEKAWIDSRMMVRTVLVTEGSAVYPMFRREVHVSRDVLRPHRGYEVTCGLDFGRSPAAIFIQAINNRVFFQFELIGSGEGAAVFAPKVKRFFAEQYPDHAIEDCRFFGDPKGQDRGQGDERNAYEIFGANGMTVRAPPSLKQNMIETRVNAVSAVLNEMTDGKPRFVSSPMCRTFNVAMAGRYCNERDEQGELKPTKNRYSHVANAAEYGILGLGEGRRLIGLPPLSQMHGVQTHKRRATMRRLEA